MQKTKYKSTKGNQVEVKQSNFFWTLLNITTIALTFLFFTFFVFRSCNVHFFAQTIGDSHSPILRQTNILFQEYKKTHLRLRFFSEQRQVACFDPSMCSYLPSILCCLFFRCIWFEHMKGSKGTFILLLWEGGCQQSILVRLILRERIPHSPWNLST